MSEQGKKNMMDALEYIKNAIEVLPVTNIQHCEIKIAAYRNTEIVMRELQAEWDKAEVTDDADNS